MKSIFITGAGSGMGREGAKLFHANGWRVGAIDRNEAGLASLNQELGADAAWAAYHDPKRLHWYVPNSIRWIDRLKGLSPEMVRGRILKSLPALIQR